MFKALRRETPAHSFSAATMSTLTLVFTHILAFLLGAALTMRILRKVTRKELDAAGKMLEEAKQHYLDMRKAREEIAEMNEQVIAEINKVAGKGEASGP